MIYFDNAATTLQKPIEVPRAVYEAINTFGNAARGAHKASLNAMGTILECREQIAQLFHFTHPKRIAFTANATQSLNIAIRGLLQKGDHVITTVLEHNSVLRPLYLCEKEGVALTILPADREGNVDYQSMEAAILDNTKAIVCTHASNLTGNVIDIRQVGQICKRHGIYFILDASQTAGILPIHMEEMLISVLCFTGHKGLFGPQGTGGICINKGIDIPAQYVGGSGYQSYNKEHPNLMPDALEAGTLNSHGLAGLNAALKFLLSQDREELLKKEMELTFRFYEGVRKIPGVRVYGDFSNRMRAPIVSLNIEDYDSGKVSDELMERFDIATRSRAHCAPLMHQSFSTVEQGMVRFSFSSFNTFDEIERGITAVRILATEED